MLVNNKLTVYHRSYDDTKRGTVWIRFNYDNVWFFGGLGSGINKGYENANNVDIRIPYGQNKDVNIHNFDIGDILVQGEILDDIETQEDLSQYQVFNITSINNNNFGSNSHIHIGGK